MLQMMVMMPMLLLMALVPLLIGVYVYRDAKRRDMNGLLWALIAVLAPGLIGFLVYLLVRGNYADLNCPQCGAAVREDFVRCPQCGTKLRPACPNCAMPVEPGWVICPRCTTPLEHVEEGVRPPVRRKDQSLWKILAVAVLVPVLLLAVLLLGSLAYSGGGGSVSLQEMSVKEYLALPEVPETAKAALESWLSPESGTAFHASALLYGEEGEELSQYRILLYVPDAGDSPRSSMGQSSSIFGTKLEISLESTGNSGNVFLIYGNSKRMPKLEVRVDGEKLPCTVEQVGADPLPQNPYAGQMEAEDPGFPQVKSLSRYINQMKAGEIVLDLDLPMAEKLANCISDAPYLDTDHPAYEAWPGVRDYYELFSLAPDGTTETCMIFRQGEDCFLLERTTPEDGRYLRQLDQEVWALLEDLFAETFGALNQT